MQQSAWTILENKLKNALMLAGDRVHITLIPDIPVKNTTPYLQYATSGTSLVCELHLSQPSQDISARCTTINTSLGWERQRGSNIEVYSRHLLLPTYSSAYASLTAQSIHILRDFLQISEPTSLTYYAWRAPEELEDGRYYSAEEVDELDVGEDPLEVDLGIEMASRRPELL